MNTWRKAARKHEEEIANMGTPPHGDQVPPLEEVVVDDQEVVVEDQAPANPPPMTEAKIRDILAQMAQAITTQAQAATVQAQAMMAQANREVAPRVHQQFSTVASQLRDFTRMNHPTFYGSKVDEDPQEFIDEGVSDDLQEECHSSMLHENMNISYLLVHVRRVEEARAKRKDRDTKRARSFESGNTNNRLEIQDKPRFKKRFSNQVGNKVRDFPNAKGQEKIGKPSGSSDAPKKNHFYALVLGVSKRPLPTC
ncbi:hypothetical protein EJD97_010104 [Solanum chilense]|uniref:Uncharacterized protein n=1 Tax=Solanum chilense TaxID=4083 RepID=A0A6N2BNJ2_SOLCI|nr:hypothetical protein EJD97_010104 [Solanum chilense]